MSTSNQAGQSTSGDGGARVVQPVPPTQLKNKYVAASEALHKLFIETGLPRDQCKTIWNSMNDLIVAERHILYFSQTATPEDRAVCRIKILNEILVKIRTWASTTCRWSDDLCAEDPAKVFAIEQKVHSLLGQAITCFELTVEGYIRTGRHYLWLLQDIVTDPPMEWQNFFEVQSTRIEYR